MKRQAASYPPALSQVNLSTTGCPSPAASRQFLTSGSARVLPRGVSPAGAVVKGADFRLRARHGPHRPLGDRCNHRSEEHTSELQSRGHLVCRLLLEKK